MIAKKKIGAREMFSMLVFLMATKLADMTPTLLSQSGANAFWMIPIVSFVVFFPSFLLLLYLLNKYENKNLVELINHLLGRYMGSFVVFLLFLTTFTATTIDVRNYVEEINIIYFPKTPTIVTFLIFMLICYFLAKKGFQNIGSLSWSVFPYVNIVLFFLLALALREVVWLRLFPIWGSGLDVILVEGVKKASLFGDLFIFTIAYTSIRGSNSFNRTSIVAGVVSLVYLVSTFLIYCALFSYSNIEQIAFPFQIMTQYVSLGVYFTNIETFFFTFWLLASFVKFTLYLYFTTWFLGYFLKIKNFHPLLLPIALLVVTLGILPENSVENLLIYRDLILTIVTPMFLCLPLILWIVSRLKGDLTKI